MKKRMMCCLMILSLLLGFSGCRSVLEYCEQIIEHVSWKVPNYSDLSYIRPELKDFEDAAQAVSDALATGKLDITMEALNRFYDTYWGYYSMTTIAMIESDSNTNDTDMWGERKYCYELANDIERVFSETLTTCARSDLKIELEKQYFAEGFLDDYISVFTPSDQLQELYDRELKLSDAYRRLYARMGQWQGTDESFYDVFSAEAAGIYLELIAARNQQAALYGYSSYAQLCYDDVNIDYSVDDLLDYFELLKQYFTPLYRQQVEAGTYDLLALTKMSAEDAFQITCDTLLANDVAGISFMLENLCEGGYYNIEASPQKLNTTYTTYIDSVEMPYLFLSPCGDLSDCLTIAHELGHCDDMHFNYNTTYSIDTAETLSTGMEYLLLCQETFPYRDELLQYKLLDSLESTLYQAALASFEYRAYGLESNELTAENLNHLFADICMEFGLYDIPQTSDAMWINVDHLFLNPCYVSSYCLADTAAFSIFIMERTATGDGETAYIKLQLNAPDYSFLKALTLSGISSPFEEQQISRQAHTIAQILK